MNDYTDAAAQANPATDVHAYWFRTLDLQGNTAKFLLQNIPDDKYVVINVENITGDKINGNQFWNANYSPHHLVINYLGATPLQFNGTADVNMVLVAPNIDLDVNGNFNYYGAIIARSLYVSGSATFNYDESTVGLPIISDLKFELRKTSQRYR